MGLVTPVEPVPLGDLGRVHFVAIGGAGMSGIARIMLARGVPVSGCDSAASAQLDELAALGAEVGVGHSADHVHSADTLVVSSAIRQDNPELAAARREGLRVLHRAAALASIMAGRQAIAVAGTHGKTTTTGMITTALRRCGADPSYVIGGILAETGLGASEGSGRAFVAEADESDGSFLMLGARRGGGDQCRGRSSGQLRQPGRDRGGVRGLRRQDRAGRSAGHVRRRSRGRQACGCRAVIDGPGARAANRDLRRISGRPTTGSAL